MAAMGVLLAMPQQAAAAGLRFADATESAGLPVARATSWGSTIADFDGDGWPDVLLNRHTQPPVLFTGGPGGFSELALPWPAPVDRHNCSWGEANGDGRPDLLCAQGTLSSTGDGPNELWLNLPDGFVESADAYGLSRSVDRGRTATWIDYDQDGDLDLFLGNAPLAGHGDVMMRNDRGVFVETTVGIEGERDTESATWADWDGNGYPDLLITVGAGRAIAFTNDAGIFTKTPIAALGARHWLGSTWGDFNGDGEPDLAVIDKSYVRILRNHGGAFTTVKNTSVTLGRSVVWVDLNNDGRLDLYLVLSARGENPGSVDDRRDLLLMATRRGTFDIIRPDELGGWHGSGDGASVLDYNHDLRMDVLVSNGRARWPGKPVLLQNVFATQHASAIRLRGLSWNPLGMGAVVELRTSAFTYRRQLNDGVAWNGQSDVSFVHLGLRGLTSGVARVSWPDGTVDCVAVSAETVVELQIGTSPCL
jgi:hypothetical protein